MLTAVVYMSEEKYKTLGVRPNNHSNFIFTSLYAKHIAWYVRGIDVLLGATFVKLFSFFFFCLVLFCLFFFVDSNFLLELVLSPRTRSL